MNLEHYTNALSLADPSLASMVEGLHDSGASLPAIKIRVRAALAKVAVKHEGIRDEIALILQTVVADGLDGPRDLDVAIDAILTLLPTNVEI